ncbi:MAG: response regulator [Anaerolineae bacterium]|nr:response regulator [Anaerolineae bacterium]
MTTSEDDLMRELLETFNVEAKEHLQNLNQALLQLERQPDEERRRELLREAFRAAHSLKGAARSVGLGEIEKLSHAIENVLQAARDANQPLGPEVCDVLYDGLDAAEKLLGGQEVEIGALHGRLAALLAPETAPAAQTGAAPAEAASPVDIFEEEPEPDFISAPGGVPGHGEAQTIRVAVQKLDDLMAQAGELIVSKISAEQRLLEAQRIRAQLEQWPKTWRDLKALLPRLAGALGDTGLHLVEVLADHNDYMQQVIRIFNELQQALNRDAVRLGMVSGDLQDEVRRVRMVPFRTLSLGLQRTVRDVARKEHKQVNLQILGEEVELDKKVLENLKDPLIHLLNNAVSHGVEAPDARTAAGKPTAGRVTITVQQRGGEVHIVVRDDGRGFDLDAIRAASAARRGPRLSVDASAEQIISLAFLAGVSTACEVTPTSGRGVGLDVVNKHLADMQGRITVETAEGKGSTICLIVPASLTMTRGLLVRVGDARYVLPLLSVEKIEEPKDIFAVEGRYMLPFNGKSLPLTTLAGALGRTADKSKPAGEMLALIIAVSDQRMALLVDEVLDELELAEKPLGKPLSHVRNVSGAALLGNGEPVVILNAADLVKSAKKASPHAVSIIETAASDPKPNAHVLIVDDSITTRTLEKNILQAAGYQVTTAIDGIEALERLENNSIDIIVADIEMPNMDGIDFTKQVRESTAYREMPVILVTSLESRENRERGMLAGADAYIVKRGFDQAELLATIEQFL